MKVSVRPRGIEWSDELKKQVKRSIAFAVDRHSARVTHISIYLADVNGPRGGVDKLCQITADLKRSTPILILEKGDDLLATVNRAARRLSYRIGRTIQRSTTSRARRPRTPVRSGSGGRTVVVSWPKAGNRLDSISVVIPDRPAVWRRYTVNRLATASNAVTMTQSLSDGPLRADQEAISSASVVASNA